MKIVFLSFQKSIVFTALFILLSCEDEGTVKTINVDSYQSPCLLWFRTLNTCFRIKDEGDTKYQVHNARIADFDYSWGHKYKLKILEDDEVDGRIDGPDQSRTLLEVLKDEEEKVGKLFKYTNISAGFNFIRKKEGKYLLMGEKPFSCSTTANCSQLELLWDTYNMDFSFKYLGASNIELSKWDFSNQSWHIAPAMGVCTEKKGLCFLVRPNTIEKFKVINHGIKDFDFKWGFYYQIEVGRSLQEEQTEDESLVETKLIKIIKEEEIDIGRPLSIEGVSLKDTTILKVEENEVYTIYDKEFSCSDKADCDALIAQSGSDQLVDLQFKYLGQGEIKLISWTKAIPPSNEN